MVISFEFLNHFLRAFEVAFVDLHRYAVHAQSHACYRGRANPPERIDHDRVFVKTMQPYTPLRQFDRKYGGMPAPLVSRHDGLVRNMPSVSPTSLYPIMLPAGQVARVHEGNPDAIRISADRNSVGLGEMKNELVSSVQKPFRIDRFHVPKCVIGCFYVDRLYPDYLVLKLEVLASNHCNLVRSPGSDPRASDVEEKRSVGFEYSMDFLDPSITPSQVITAN